MSMPNQESLVRHTSTSTKLIGTVLTLKLVSGCGTYGDPLIVSGVPAQIDYKISQSEYDASNPPLWPEVYYFGLEQCTADIELAQKGNDVTDPGFNPDLHTYAPDCFIRRMEVPREVYENHEEGEVLVFEGPVGEPINHISG